MAVERKQPKKTTEEDVNPAPEQELGPLQFNISIGRSKNLMSVSHTITDGTTDITLIIEAMSQITKDLQETLTQFRMQEAVSEANQKQDTTAKK